MKGIQERNFSLIICVVFIYYTYFSHFILTFLQGVQHGIHSSFPTTALTTLWDRLEMMTDPMTPLLQSLRTNSLHLPNIRCSGSIWLQSFSAFLHFTDIWFIVGCIWLHAVILQRMFACNVLCLRAGSFSLGNPPLLNAQDILWSTKEPTWELVYMSTLINPSISASAFLTWWETDHPIKQAYGPCINRNIMLKRKCVYWQWLLLAKYFF